MRKMTKSAIGYEDPILQDKELIELVGKALWDKTPYGKWAADINTIQARLNRDVPLLRWLEVKSPRELRETNRREELMMALQVINSDIKPAVFFDHIKKYKEDLIAL